MEIRWTNAAIIALVSLRDVERKTLLDRLELVSQFPLMYPARQRGRFRGLRYFFLARKWIVYYRVAETGILIFDIVPALARPR